MRYFKEFYGVNSEKYEINKLIRKLENRIGDSITITVEMEGDIHKDSRLLIHQALEIFAEDILMYVNAYAD